MAKRRFYPSWKKHQTEDQRDYLQNIDQTGLSNTTGFHYEIGLISQVEQKRIKSSFGLDTAKDWFITQVRSLDILKIAVFIIKTRILLTIPYKKSRKNLIWLSSKIYET